MPELLLAIVRDRAIALGAAVAAALAAALAWAAFPITLVALRGKDIDIFLSRPDATRPIILLYGPDAGLVRERAEALVKSAVDDVNDPFSLVRMDGDDLAAEPSRLVEEAMTNCSKRLSPTTPPTPARVRLRSMSEMRRD